MQTHSAIAITSHRLATVELLVLATPLVLVSLSRLLMGFADTYMVSFLGTDALAAVTPASMLIWACLSIGMGAATSVQTFASQADGRGEPRLGAGYAWQTIYIGFAMTVLVAPLSYYSGAIYSAIAGVGGQTQSVLALQIDYLGITIWSMTPAVLSSGLEGFFNGLKRPRITLWAAIASLLVNVLFNWLLIFGPTIVIPWSSLPVFGAGLADWSYTFPAWGVWGAGLATVLGWWARAIVLLVVFLGEEHNTRFGTRAAFAISAHKLAGIARIGLPTAAQWLFEVSAWVVFMNLIAPHYGPAANAANSICLQWTHVAFMPAVGIGMALCSQVGFAMGARRPHEAEFRTHVALLVNMIYMAAAGLALWAFRWPLVRLMSSDPTVIDVGMWIMLWVALYQVFDAMSITFIFALRGAGDTARPAVLNAGCCWTLFVGGGALFVNFAPQVGIHGPWFMAVSYLTLLGLLLLWRFQAGEWKTRVVLHADAPTESLASEGAVPAPFAEGVVSDEVIAAEVPKPAPSGSSRK